MAYVFDLGNPATNANPFPEFARLRVEDPVHWSPAMKAWIVTRYADVKQVALNNRQISADRLTPFFKTNPEYQKGSIESLVRYLNHWMVFRDPPDHTRLRRLFNKAFTPTSVENLRPNIEDIVAHLIDGMQAKAKRGETVDYIADFAYPLPASVIMDLLGVPRADLERVKVWSDDIALFIGTAQVAGNKYLRAESGAKAMSDYFRVLVEDRTAAPRDDMISQLVLARDDRDALSTDEIIGTCDPAAVRRPRDHHQPDRQRLPLFDEASRRNGSGWSPIRRWPRPRSRSSCATTARRARSPASPPPTSKWAARPSARASASSPS